MLLRLPRVSRWLSGIAMLAVWLCACGEKDAPSATSSGSAGSAGMTGSGAASGGASGAAGSSGGGSPGGAMSVGGTGGGAGNISGAPGMSGSSVGGGPTTPGPPAWTRAPFIMDTWFWSDGASPASAVSLVKQRGFAAMALSSDRSVPEYVTALTAEQLPMVGVYTPTPLDGYPTGVVDAVAVTSGWIWLSIQGGPHAASDPAGDPTALELIDALADECEAKGLAGVALYPHVGFWMERVGDAVRLASKADRANVRVVFNQYHWMVVEGGQDLANTLRSAEPFLQFVTINGSDIAPSILPLGQGAYDVKPILDELTLLDFHGNVGLQGYSISGDIDAKLMASKQAWDALVAGLDFQR